MTRIALSAVAALVAALALVTVFKSEPGDEEKPRLATPVDTAERAAVHRFWELYRSATSHRTVGRLPQAAQDYARALELHGEHQDALYYLGNVRFDLGDYSGAENAWQRLVQINPQSARAHSRLGDLYSCVEHRATFDPEKAKSEFRRASALNKEETGPLLGLGAIALIENDLHGAEQYLDAVIGSHAQSVEASYLKGYIAWSRGDRQLATSLFAQAVSHAQRTEGTDGVIGEGDTRAGSTPLLTNRPVCRSIHQPADDLGGLSDREAANHADPEYERLDRLLLDARRPPP